MVLKMFIIAIQLHCVL